VYIEAGVTPELKKIDDYTIKFIFPYPYYFAETAFACLSEWAWPKHHMKQWHPDYNKDATWDEWNDHVAWIKGRGKVTIQAWMLDKYIPGQKVSYVRNPYYWKVDPEGNQLPYIDRVVVRIVETRENVALGNVSGEFDVDAMWVGTQHLSLFLEEKEKRDYEVGYSTVSGMAMYFNYDTPDEVPRKLIHNVNFRRAFSLAINREEISRVMFWGNLKPLGWIFSPNSAYYEEETGKLYSEYDPRRAKKLLDEAGMKDRDGDGIRELPTGEEVKIIIDVSEHDLYTPTTEMVVEDLAKVGIKAIMNVQHQRLIEERRFEGNFQVHVWDFYYVDEPLVGLETWVPVTKNLPFWHQKASEATFSPEYDEFTKILLKAKRMPYEERVAAMKKANRIQAENVFGVYIGAYKRPFIHSNRIGNIPEAIARIDEFGCDTPPMRLHQAYVKYER